MKVTKITFEQLYPTGQYANQRLGIEIDVSDDSPSEIVGWYQYAMDKVNSAFKALNPDLSTPSLTDCNTGQPAAPPVIDYKAKERLEILIDNATTLPELVQYNKEAEKYGLHEQFAKKAEELSK